MEPRFKIPSEKQLVILTGEQMTELKTYVPTKNASPNTVRGGNQVIIFPFQINNNY